MVYREKTHDRPALGVWLHMMHSLAISSGVVTHSLFPVLLFRLERTVGEGDKKKGIVNLQMNLIFSIQGILM